MSEVDIGDVAMVDVAHDGGGHGDVFGEAYRKLITECGVKSLRPS